MLLATQTYGEASPELAVWSIIPCSSKIRLGEEMVARIKVIIAEGYHLYSPSQPPGGPFATRISAAPNWMVCSVRPWPRPIHVSDAKFGMETEQHIGTVSFDVTVRSESSLSPGEHEVVFQVEYQLCGAQLCLRPESRQLRTTFVLGAPTPANVPHPRQVLRRGRGNQQAPPQLSPARLEQLFAEHRKGKDLETGVRRILNEDPRFVQGYTTLARIAGARGDLRTQRSVLRQGLVANPKSDVLHFELATSSPLPSRKRLRRFVSRFRKSPWALPAMLDLAQLSNSHVEQRKLLEDAYPLSVHGSNDLWRERTLCALLAKDEPRKAIGLLNTVSRRARERGNLARQQEVSELLGFYRSIHKVHKLSGTGKCTEALRIAMEMQEPTVPYTRTTDAEQTLLAISQATALVASSRVEQAYDLLVRHPLVVSEQELLDAAISIGTLIRKSRNKVRDEAWRLLLQKDYPLAQFRGVNVPRKPPLGASDYRGRVLLVNVWNPG